MHDAFPYFRDKQQPSTQQAATLVSRSVRLGRKLNRQARGRCKKKPEFSWDKFSLCRRDFHVRLARPQRNNNVTFHSELMDMPAWSFEAILRSIFWYGTKKLVQGVHDIFTSMRSFRARLRSGCISARDRDCDRDDFDQRNNIGTPFFRDVATLTRGERECVPRWDYHIDYAEAQKPKRQDMERLIRETI